VQAIQKEMVNVRAGSSMDSEGNRLRGLFTDSHASRVVKLVNDAVEKGAKVVVGDPSQAGRYEGGNIVQPFVLDYITPEMGALRRLPLASLFGSVHLTSRLCSSNRHGLAGDIRPCRWHHSFLQ
jgi:acyl-CoA reductase-like NAD-dependent aldehyde dehydrogenase